MVSLFNAIMSAGKGAGSIFGTFKDGGKDVAKDFFSGKLPGR